MIGTISTMKNYRHKILDHNIPRSNPVNRRMILQLSKVVDSRFVNSDLNLKMLDIANPQKAVRNYKKKLAVVVIDRINGDVPHYTMSRWDCYHRICPMIHPRNRI